jgi:LysM repeat protein
MRCLSISAKSFALAVFVNHLAHSSHLHLERHIMSMEINQSPVFNHVASPDVETNPKATDAASQQGAQMQDIAAAPADGTPVTRSSSLPLDSAIPANIAIQLRQPPASNAQSDSSPNGMGSVSSAPNDTATDIDGSGPSAYTVQPGDSLWKIAAKLLGDGSRWPEIVDLNPELQSNPDLIHPGDVLLIPSTTSPASDSELYNTSGPNPNQPSLSDIHQATGSQGCGDCFFLASLGALVQADPNAVQNMIKDNGDGTYTVTFYQKNQDGEYTQNPITVSADEVAQFYNKENTPTDPNNDGAKIIWPAVMEAAYAKMNPQICDGGMHSSAMEALTGHDTQTYKPIEAGELNNLQSQFDSGQLITMGYAQSGNSQYNVYAHHAYTVTNVYVNPDNGKTYVTLNNPWGTDQPRDIPLEDLPNVFGGITVGTP